MKTMNCIVGLLAGIAGLGLQRTLGVETGTNQPADQRNDPVAIRIVEASGCAINGIRLRVEIRNQLDEPYRFSICPERLLCCVNDMFIEIAYDDRGVCLLDKEPANVPEECYVVLVKGAVYSFPMTIPLDRLPEDCRTQGTSVDIKLGFQAAKRDLIYSDKAKVNLQLKAE